MTDINKLKKQVASLMEEVEDIEKAQSGHVESPSILLLGKGMVESVSGMFKGIGRKKDDLINKGRNREIRKTTEKLQKANNVIAEIMEKENISTDDLRAILEMKEAHDKTPNASK
jgi:flagellar biosynthesis/type III secretory pathway chaperone